MQGDSVDIGYIRDTIVIEQLKKRGDLVRIVISIDGNRTLDFSDLGDKSYLVEVKDRLGDVLTKATISKADIRRLAKAS